MFIYFFSYISGYIFFVISFYNYIEEYLYLLSIPYFNLLGVQTFVITDFGEILGTQLYLLILTSIICLLILFFINLFIYVIPLLLYEELHDIFKGFFKFSLVFFGISFLFFSYLTDLMTYFLSFSLRSYNFLVDYVIDIKLVNYVRQFCGLLIFIVILGIMCWVLFIIFFYIKFDFIYISLTRHVYYILLFLCIILFLPGEIYIHFFFLSFFGIYFESFVFSLCVQKGYKERVA